MNKTTHGPWLLALVLVVFLGCTSGSEPIDPTAVQARVAESQAEFRALAGSTIEDAGRTATFVSLLDKRDALIARYSETVRRYAESMKTPSIPITLQPATISTESCRLTTGTGVLPRTSLSI